MSTSHSPPPNPSSEGLIPFTPPSLPSQPCSTFYKLFGTLSPSVPPVIMLHGGPGAGHGVLLPFTHLLTRYSIPVILYDQIGCGNSTHLRDKAGDKSFWVESLFISELENLIHHFDLDSSPTTGYFLFGFSWGAMLASAFAATQPKGLLRLVLASGVASMELGQASIERWKGKLPREHREAIEEAVGKREFTGEEYKAAVGEFAKMVLVRNRPWPPEELKGVWKNQMEDPTVNRTMLGGSNFTNEGGLKGWTVVERLERIEVPTLVYNGEFDTSDDGCCWPFFEGIKRVRWRTVNGAGHMCHLEGEEVRREVVGMVGDFLNQKEG